MYCEYKKAHGWKLLAFISHKKGPSGKCYILKVKASTGRTFDGTLYQSMITELGREVIEGVYVLGDHAFYGQLLALCPYTNLEMETAVLDRDMMATFNHNHSSSRIMIDSSDRLGTSPTLACPE
jgi:hypothetical protein